MSVSAPAYRQVGRDVGFARTLAADTIDAAPALTTTVALWRTGTAPHAVAFLVGLAVWLINPILARSLTSTSVGGMFADIAWVRPDGRPAPVTAYATHAVFGATYTVFVLAAWLMFAIVMPWRLLNPATYKAFVSPNTALCGLIADRRSR